MIAKGRKRMEINVRNNSAGDANRNGELTYVQLTFIGVGGIIGAGFFLGLGLPIHLSGPSVLFAFVIGAVLTSQVVGALTSVSASHPVSGSFKAHADMFVSRFAGYMQGWIYYLASILTISSEAVAMAVFARVWVPNVPLWISTVAFCAVIILLNAFGIKNFGNIETVMSVVKIAALVGFVVFAIFIFFGDRSAAVSASLSGLSYRTIFPNGITGLLQSMLIVIFSFAGIGVFATATSEVKNPIMIDRAAIMTMVILTGLYLASIGLLLTLQPWQTFGTSQSPFVEAIHHTGAIWLAYMLNAVILVASFSVMVGAVFSANQILISLGQSRQAPRFVTRVSKREVPYGSLVATTICIAASIIISNLLPANVYNLLISASSFFTFFTWFLILWTFLKWRRLKEPNRHMSSLAFGQPIMTVVTMLAILLLTGYALLQRDERIGFYVSVLFMLIVAFSYLFVKRHNRGRGDLINYGHEGRHD